MHSDAKRGSNLTGGKEVTCVRVPPGGNDQYVISRCYFVRGLLGIDKLEQLLRRRSECAEVSPAVHWVHDRLYSTNRMESIVCSWLEKDVVVAAPSTFTICIVALAHTRIFV